MPGLEKYFSLTEKEKEERFLSSINRYRDPFVFDAISRAEDPSLVTTLGKTTQLRAKK